MTLRSVFENRPAEEILKISEQICDEINLDWNSFECIVRAAIEDPTRVSDPLYAAASNTQRDKLQKWLTKINNGYLNRPSQKTDTPMTTLSDPLIDIIFERYDYDNVEEIRINHRNSMKVENKLGELLEEYIHTNISGTNWRVAWGESLKQIDLVRCDENGTIVLLQVKNKHNSGNSSAAQAQAAAGTGLWWRLNKNGSTNWPLLCSTLGLEDNAMTETRYRNWINRQIRANQDMISFE